MARLLSIHAGRIQPLAGRPGTISAIAKRPLAGRIAVGEAGLDGDQVADKRHHGGPFKALCAYSSEYYLLWRDRFGLSMPPGSFGENLALEGLPDEEVCLGDVYLLGDVRAQVTGPRGPCGTLSAHWGIPTFHTEVKRARKTGFYLRVLDDGELEAGLAVRLVERPAERWDLVTFWDFMDAERSGRADITQLLAMDFLDDDWKRRLEKRISGG